MCNRFALPASPEELAEHFELSEVPALVRRYNVSPGEEILVVRADAGSRVLQRSSWGLRRARGQAKPLLNVRAETLRGRAGRGGGCGRALVPAGGFFEWRHVGRARQPFYFRLKDSPLLGLAAVCETTSALPPGQACAIVTTPPNPLVAEVHDRMPAIIRREAYARWLDPRLSLTDVLELLQPFPAEAMTAYPVSSLVNRSGVEDPRAIEPARQQTLF